VRGRVGPAVAGADALAVAVDAVDAVGGLEVGKVPSVFAHHRLDPVERLMARGQTGCLVVLRPRLVAASNGV
jgi:hypothetical protein